MDQPPRSGNAAAAAAKGNSGVARMKRHNQRIMAFVIGFLVLYVAVLTIYEAHFAGMFVPDIEVDESGRARVRRRPDRHRKRMDPKEKTTTEDAILEGYFTMVELYVPPNGLQGIDPHYKAQATFCKIDWKYQSKNPSQVPMFRDLRSRSDMCEATLVTVDLYDVVQKAQRYDAQMNTTEFAIQAVPPKGVVFHETRCGSTLVANLLASAAPENTRVYSESPPPVNAFRACDHNPCNPTLHTQMIRDVFYMMGRTTRKEKPQYVFYKIQSVGAMNIDKFTEAFPRTPWSFIYRDSVEIMQSHWKGREGSLTSATPVCARYYNSPRQPVTTQAVLKAKHKSLDDMNKVEYCAAHLAGLSLSAIQEHERTGKGRFINYNQLPSAVWETLFPNDYGIPVTPKMIGRMQKVSSVYSKGRGTGVQKWEEDSAKKQQTASEVIVNAANEYVTEYYQQMEKLSGH